MTRSAQFLDDDPIEQAEFAHLQRSNSGHHGHWVFKFFYIAFAFSVLITAIVPMITGRSVAGPFFSPRSRMVNPAQTLLLAVDLILMALIVGTQIVLIVQALLITSDAVARERHNNTWDLLLMAGHGGGQIISGKWWAAQGYLFQSHRTLIFLRAGAVLWLGLALAGGSISNQPDLIALALAPALVLLFTLLDLALASAAGMVASTLTRRGLSFVAAIALYLSTAALFGLSYPLIDALTGSFGRLLTVPPLLYRFNVPLALLPTPLDGGMLIGLRLQEPIPSNSWLFTLGLVTLNLIVLAVLTWLLLQLAGGLARRHERSGP